MSRFKISAALWDRIHHFASFPQTGGAFSFSLHSLYPTLSTSLSIPTPKHPCHHRICPGTPSADSPSVSLQQMVLFGQNPSQGTLLKASQFLVEELPIRLSHRVVELESLPDGLSKMPSIEKVKEWYAQSFEVSLGCCSSHSFTCDCRREGVG